MQFHEIAMIFKLFDVALYPNFFEYEEESHFISSFCDYSLFVGHGAEHGSAFFKEKRSGEG